MQLDETDKAQAKPAETAGAKDGAQDGGKEGSTEATKEGQKEAAAPKEPEPSSHSLDNPARVVPAQEKLVKFPEGSRYTPIRPGRTAGILLLKDSTPGNHSTFVAAAAMRGTSCQLACIRMCCCVRASATSSVIRFDPLFSWHHVHDHVLCSRSCCK